MRRILIIVLSSLSLLVVIGLLAPKSWRNDFDERFLISSFFENQKGVASLKAGDATQANRFFTEAVGAAPGFKSLVYNLAVSLQILKRVDESVKTYEQVAANPAVDQKNRFHSEFNQGVIFHEAKDIDLALKHYQAALDFGVSDLEAKTNIELLIQSSKGGGGGQGKDKNDKKDPNQDQSDSEGDKDKEKQKDDKPKQYSKNPTPAKKPFKSDKLDQTDVKKILDELKNQEQKIRSEFNKKETKQQPRDKDW